MKDAREAELAEAFRLLHTEPARAESLCRSVLAKRDNPSARLLLAGALRLQGDFAGARAFALALTREFPAWPGAHFELGMALGRLNRDAEALEVLRKVEGLGGLPGLWREIGDRCWRIGDATAAERNYTRHLSAPAPEPLMHEAFAALQRTDTARAEQALCLQLQLYPSDVLALRYLAEVYSATDRYDEAELLLAQCLERVPSFALARYGLAMVLFHNHKFARALDQAERLLALDPLRLEYLHLKADALGRIGDFEAAATFLEALVLTHPSDTNAWLSYGHALRALGRREECEAAYRRVIALNAQAGEGYWGLANLKTFKFEEPDLADLRERAARPVSAADQTPLLFALGKALEDQRQFESAFAAYSQANRTRLALIPHDGQEQGDAMRRARTVFTPAFFAERAGQGCPAHDPIFVVGMPRAGSTLVEQILASHSAVEGTMELIELMAIAKRLGRDAPYPELLRDASDDELRQLGEEYLDRTRAYRKTDAVRFIDKLPNNFTQIGLIQLILPNAQIIDVRRHPLACCMSNFKQHWAMGQTFAYDLANLGEYYRCYVELMAHFDAVLPGRVHRVIYEDLVADSEMEIRRLLQACGLSFEEQCLRFHENRRVVRTPSSEQVRQPIFNTGLDDWRCFEPWLAPLKSALGPVLDAYPGAPQSQAISR